MRADIVRIDAKGRITIPYHIREAMALNSTIELVITIAEDGLKISPVVGDKTAEIQLSMKDEPGMLSRVLNELADTRVNIVISQSFENERGKTAYFNAIADISNIRNVEKFRERIKNIEGVTGVKIIER